MNRDTELAVMVVDNDDRIDGRYLDVHQGLLNLLALQAPVASDLRLVAAVLHTIHHIERIGDLMREHREDGAADGTSRRREPTKSSRRSRLPETRPATRSGRRASRSSERDMKLAEDLVSQDDVIDRLNRAGLPRGGRDRRRRARPRVGRARDADRPLHRADRRQHRRHRRADRVRGERRVPRVHRRLASRKPGLEVE